MNAEYQLQCESFGVYECLKATAISYTDETAPEKQRYFSAERDGRCVCFIKLQNEQTDVDLSRTKIERLSGQINSPFIVAQIPPGVIRPLSMEWWDGKQWEPLPGKILLMEYLPQNLEQFWYARINGVNERHLECDRGHILLKLLEGVGHLHQSNLVHRDIKPQNIMINCRGLCKGAKWFCDEPDVKLTDFDSAHDECVQGAAFFTGSKPFQPEWHYQSNSWLDLYSVCMVALWLYGDNDALREFSRRRCQNEGEIYGVLNTGHVVYPEGFLKCIVPAIFLSAQGISPQGTKRSFSAALQDLSDGLHGFYFGERARRPVELLEPSRDQTEWSAVLQIDEDDWPVFGRGREYRILSMVDRIDSQAGPDNTGDLPVFFSDTQYMPGKTKLGPYMLSEPPEIWVAYMDQAGPRRLSVRMFGTVQQPGDGGFRPQCLMEQNDILPGTDAVLYAEQKQIQTWQERKSLFQKIRIHSVNFYEQALPAPLPAPREKFETGCSNINIVLIMGISGEKGRNDLSCRLLRQIVTQVSSIKECRPCYYGMTMLRGNPWSVVPFCTGDQDVGAETLIGNFCGSSGGKMFKDKFSWEMTEKGVCSFSSKRPTVVICFLERAVGVDQVARLRQELRKLSREFVYAVDYLQVFLPFELSDEQKMREPSEKRKMWERYWEPMLPYLAALVRPEGAFVVTGLSANRKADKPVDTDARWLRAVHLHCEQTADEKKGGRNIV